MSTMDKICSHITCIHCGSDHEIWTKPGDLESWSNGELIQEVLHYLSEDDRELLISEICDICYGKLFPEDD